MDNFSFFIQQGLSHITDINAYDHILFIIALAAAYDFKAWKKTFFLVTGFTIGHSLALALATLELVKINSAVVEFLIPVSIIATCIWNCFSPLKKEKKAENSFIYLIITFFGLIHGLGFSNYLRFMLTSEDTLFVPLLAFNVGLEIGQLAILAIALMINFVFLELLKIKQQYWSFIVSLIVMGISLPILFETSKALF